MLLSSSRSEIVTRGAIGMLSGKGGNAEQDLEEEVNTVDAILTLPGSVSLENILLSSKSWSSVMGAIFFTSWNERFIMQVEWNLFENGVDDKTGNNDRRSSPSDFAQQKCNPYRMERL